MAGSRPTFAKHSKPLTDQTRSPRRNARGFALREVGRSLCGSRPTRIESPAGLAATTWSKACPAVPAFSVMASHRSRNKLTFVFWIPRCGSCRTPGGAPRDCSNGQLWIEKNAPN